MNFSTEVITVLDELGKRFGLFVDWTSENVMPYVQDIGGRIVNYELATSIMWAVIGLLFIISFIVIVKCYDKLGEFDFMILIVGACLAFAGIIMIVCQTLDIIKCLTIPEAVWIDYIKNMTSSK